MASCIEKAPTAPAPEFSDAPWIRFAKGGGARGTAALQAQVRMQQSPATMVGLWEASDRVIAVQRLVVMIRLCCQRLAAGRLKARRGRSRSEFSPSVLRPNRPNSSPDEPAASVLPGRTSAPLRALNLASPPTAYCFEERKRA